jgi:hypothetical protein
MIGWGVGMMGHFLVAVTMLGASWFVPDNAVVQVADKEPGGLNLGAKVQPMHWSNLTKAQFGDAWPLTVDSAWVGCTTDMGLQFVIVDGVPRAFDGMSKGMAASYGWSIDGVAVVSEKSPEPWWRPNPQNPDLRVSNKPLMDAFEAMTCPF